MFDASIENLRKEIRAAQKVCKERLEVVREQIKRYHTPAYEGVSMSIDSADYWPHNHYYDFIRLVGPQIAYDNPRVTITSQRSARQKKEAEALTAAVNRWARDSQVYALNDRVLVDFCFGLGVVKTTQRPVPGADFDDPPHMPQCARVSPERFVMDSAALDHESARFKGEAHVRDHDDLIREAQENADGTWDLAAVKAMKPGTGEEMIERDQDAPSLAERNEVVYFEIWVPELQIDPRFTPELGFNGTLFTVPMTDPDPQAKKDEAERWPRKPRPYYGPRWGPYTIYGSYYVPDKPFPLSPLMATEGLVLEANEVARAQSRAAVRRKRIALLDGLQADAQKIVDAKDGEAVTVEGFDKTKVLEIELGGNTPEQYEYRALVAANLDKGTGIGDPQRGIVTGEGTATENQLAALASSTSTGYLARRFRDAETQKLKTVAWYFSEDDRTVMSLGDEAETLGQAPIFLGGRAGQADRVAQAGRLKQMFPDIQITARDLVEMDQNDPSAHESFDSLDLEIVPFSMRRVDEAVQQQQSNELVTLFATLAPLMVQFPFVDWVSLIEEWGTQRGIDDAGRYVNQMLALQFATLSLTAANAGAPPQNETPQARKSSDLPEKGAKSQGFTTPPAAGRQMPTPTRKPQARGVSSAQRSDRRSMAAS